MINSTMIDREIQEPIEINKQIIIQKRDKLYTCFLMYKSSKKHNIKPKTYMIILVDIVNYIFVY